ncbi:lysozyme inhibitor LprI family protein [Microcoleus sp. Pol12B4]|uniref:lysozyme inhibitor LprI family protein n=1 Tax=Microcoleus sp. Pol12B4 TaxID=3055395 RepID=UPI002FCFCD95
MAQYKQVIQNLPNEKQLYGQARSSRQVAVLFRPLLPKLQRETKVPILLPSELEFFSQLGQSIYVEGRGETNGYKIQLGRVPNCQSVTACFFGYFEAKRGGIPNSNADKEVRLTKGITGYFVEMPRRVSAIQWVYKGVLYTVQLKTDEATVIQIANSAIEADSPIQLLGPNTKTDTLSSSKPAICNQPQTQGELNNCAAALYQQADIRLNEVYKQVISKLNRRDREKLMDEQLAWIQRRDASCKDQGRMTPAGSAYAGARNACLAGETDKRTAELEKYLPK